MNYNCIVSLRIYLNVELVLKLHPIIQMDVRMPVAFIVYFHCSQVVSIPIFITLLVLAWSNKYVWQKPTMAFGFLVLGMTMISCAVVSCVDEFATQGINQFMYGTSNLYAAFAVYFQENLLPRWVSFMVFQ